MRDVARINGLILVETNWLDRLISKILGIRCHWELSPVKIEIMTARHVMEAMREIEAEVIESNRKHRERMALEVRT